MTDEEKVLAANQRFYTALETLDLDAMDALWLHEEWVGCVHPGWELLTGWEEVRSSWERIFENTRRMQVGVSNLALSIQGTIAWVNCVEQVTSSFDTGFSTAWVLATNIYCRRNGEWFLVHHHASPLPRNDEETVQ